MSDGPLDLLPADLIEFLRAESELNYDAEQSEAGRVRLRDLGDLALQLFPMDTQSTEIHEADPHSGELGCYLVCAVDLLAEAEEYDPTGLLLWLPLEGQFGTWDSDHCTIRAFPVSVGWREVESDPVRYLNAQWGLEGAASADWLVPWNRHDYSPQQVFVPQGLSPREGRPR